MSGLSEDEAASFAGAPSSVRETNPRSFAGSAGQQAGGGSGSDTEELDSDVEAQMHAAWVAEQKLNETKRKRKRVEIISPAMQGAQQVESAAAAAAAAAAAGCTAPAIGGALPSSNTEAATHGRSTFTERAIGGISIAFPAGLKPHAPQVAVMAKVVTALRLKKHALLEAPTGTGKSLALLSAALAWQAAEAKKLQVAAGGDMSTSRQAAALREKAVFRRSAGSYREDGIHQSVGSSANSGHATTTAAMGGGEEANRLLEAIGGSLDHADAPPAPPRIFVCSRTHSQIAQLLTELKRTPYKPEMTVLGSRSRYCCNAEVQKSKNNVDAMCAQAVNARSCSFHPKADLLAYELSKLRVWDMGDIEDLRAADGGGGGGCPFFATRQLAEGASLVFAPYNYIFDAGVRAALQIDVTGAAIIIDEGHNLEDVCRESASFDITATALSTCNREIETMSKKFPQLDYVAVFVRRFSEWFERVTAEVGLRHGGERIQMPGVSVAEMSDAIGLPPSLPYERLCKLGFEASCNVQEILKEQGAAGWGTASLLAAEKLCCRCMDMLTAKPEDYRVVVRSGDRGSFSSSFGRGGRGRRGSGAAQRGGRDSGGKEASFHIWCLNSAVSFAPVAEQARCVIITSGTLAPMAGMQGELGAQFPLKLEAQHVIPPRQLHVEALAELGEVVYKNYSGQRGAVFNDQLGGILLSRLPVIPNGALCFFSSYALMERAVERWQETTIWDQLSQMKHIVQEGRGADSFADTIEEYYNAVTTGALLLAVCRGKVSEGLDFKGEKARAVFVVGIPFPSYQDTKVKLKQEFNDSSHARVKREGAVSAGALVLPGGTWYRQQGYRAYNQAIGRCIRNLADYGAVLLVDARFHTDCEGAHRHREQLSRWLRSRVKQFHPSESPKALADFFAKLEANPPVEPSFHPPAGEAEHDPNVAAESTLRGVGDESQSSANLSKAATREPTERTGTDKDRYNAPSFPTALEMFASNFHPPAGEAEHDPNVAAESTLRGVGDESQSAAGSAMTTVEATKDTQEQECTAVIFEKGPLGLEFVQQADRVVVSAVRPGLAAKLPFPKIKEGMQLLRVSCETVDELTGLESNGAASQWRNAGGEVVVRPPAAAWAAKLARMPRPLTLVMTQVKRKAGMQMTIDSIF